MSVWLIVGWVAMAFCLFDNFYAKNKEDAKFWYVVAMLNWIMHNINSKF